MAKSTRYLESPANEWENSFDYRVTWGVHTKDHFEGRTLVTEQLESGEKLYKKTMMARTTVMTACMMIIIIATSAFSGSMRMVPRSCCATRNSFS